MQGQWKCDRDPAIGERLVTGLANVRAQTMIIFGRQDCVCSVANAELTRAGIKHAETVIFDRCGHFPWVERKSDTFAKMEKFLKS
jgi:pimeloyl-ACP methyl ester carboxylesterase